MTLIVSMNEHEIEMIVCSLHNHVSVIQSEIDRIEDRKKVEKGMEMPLETAEYYSRLFAHLEAIESIQAKLSKEK